MYRTPGLNSYQDTRHNNVTYNNMMHKINEKSDNLNDSSVSFTDNKYWLWLKLKNVSKIPVK